MSMTIGKDDKAITVQGHTDFWKDAYLLAYGDLEMMAACSDEIDARCEASAYAADCALRAFAARMPGRQTMTAYARKMDDAITGKPQREDGEKPADGMPDGWSENDDVDAKYCKYGIQDGKRGVWVDSDGVNIMHDKTKIGAQWAPVEAVLHVLRGAGHIR